MTTGWDGSGNFTRGDGTREGATTWALAKTASQLIDAPAHDTHDEILADGIEACLAKNGENAMTGALNMGSQNITNGALINATRMVIQDAGATESIYINKPSTSGDFLDFWLNSIASVFSVSALGAVTCTGLTMVDATAPSSASDTGTAGEVRFDSDYMYRCTATNTWKRTALSTW